MFFQETNNASISYLPKANFNKQNQYMQKQTMDIYRSSHSAPEKPAFNVSLRFRAHCGEALIYCHYVWSAAPWLSEKAGDVTRADGVPLPSSSIMMRSMYDSHSRESVGLFVFLSPQEDGWPFYPSARLRKYSQRWRVATPVIVTLTLTLTCHPSRLCL